MKAQSFFILGSAATIAEARAAFEAMTEASAKQYFTKLQSPSGDGVDLDISFDVNCSDNADVFCYDYCISYCAIQPAAQEYPFQYCQDHLPPGCNALFGGMKIVQIQFGGASDTWVPPDTDNTQIRKFNVAPILAAAQSVLSNRNVEFTEVYLGIPPTASEQTWISKGAVEPAIDEGSSAGVLCGKTLNNTSSISQEFTALDSNARSSTFAAAQERRGVQNSGMYVAKRGWKLWQQFVPHWENELLKRFFMIPLSKNFLINDALFPDQYSKEAMLLQQKIDSCVAGLQIKVQPMALFLVWGKSVTGQVIPGLKHTFEDYTDDWGWPIPRINESCQDEATTCSKCISQSTASGKPCQWCMTAMGQTCVSNCEDTFNAPLSCS